MKFGVCKSFDGAKSVKDAGFDYVELNFKKIYAMTDEEFSEGVKLLKDVDIKSESANCFFLDDIALVGENVDYQRIEQYTEFILKRANALGIKIAVLGSGKSRSIPDGFDKNIAIDQFKKVVEICARIGKKYGVKIAIEPLSQRDSNFLNTVRETAELLEKVDADNVGIAADFFHMYMNGETMADFEYAAKWIIHLHIAKPDACRFAPSIDDIETLKKWAQSIKNIGFNGCMTLESTSKQDFETALKDMNSVKYIFE